MKEKRLSCVNCSLIRPLDDEEKKLYPQNLAWCEGEGGTKTKADIYALRHCSRFKPGENDLHLLPVVQRCSPVRCLNCSKLDKLAYKLATPTHHQNWLCRYDGDTKQYEDCSALRCCNHFKPKT